MCEWYRRDYVCRHYLVGVAVWCPQYSLTQRRCTVRVCRVDTTSEECPHCRPNEDDPVPWEHMIDRSKGRIAAMQWFKAKD